jgi:hypothetical protein
VRTMQVRPRRRFVAAAFAVFVAASGVAGMMFFHTSAIRAAPTHAPSTCLSPVNPHVAPPAGFVPANASNAQLRCYGLPSRPTNPEALANWTRIASHELHYVVPIVVVVKGLIYPAFEPSVGVHNVHRVDHASR